MSSQARETARVPPVFAVVPCDYVVGDDWSVAIGVATLGRSPVSSPLLNDTGMIQRSGATQTSRKRITTAAMIPCFQARRFCCSRDRLASIG